MRNDMTNSIVLFDHQSSALSIIALVSLLLCIIEGQFFYEFVNSKAGLLVNDESTE